MAKQGTSEIPDWSSFWDLATPEDAADMLRESYGEGAAQAAMECAVAAQKDNRQSDHQFWMAVYAELRTVKPGEIEH